MKALSVKQPYASRIASGTKRFEYRSRPIRYRGPLLIAAAKVDAERGLPDDLPRGAAVCIVDVIDCHEDSRGGYAWHLANPRPVKTFPVHGQVGIFHVEHPSLEGHDKPRRSPRRTD